MNKRIVLAFLLLAGAMISFDGTQNGTQSQAAAQEKSSLAAKPQTLIGCSFIDPLDDCIQTRFTQTNRGFGVERVLKPFHAPIPSIGYIDPQRNMIGMFLPENDREREAIAEIEQSDLKMTLYLASRRVLITEPDEAEREKRFMLHKPFRGPVGITRSAQKSDWPEALSLWKQSQKAMQDFDSNKSVSQYEFIAGDINFTARPVRAQESCLKCHTPEVYQREGSNNGAAVRQLSVGDPIGVLIYAYTRPTKSNNVKKP